jgi:hypothetical protein
MGKLVIWTTIGKLFNFDLNIQSQKPNKSRALSASVVVNQTANCLMNVPANIMPNETTQVTYERPGLLWNADDQCKQLHGANASFCRVRYLFRLFKYFIN